MKRKVFVIYCFILIITFLVLTELLLRRTYVKRYPFVPWQVGERYVLDSELIYKLKPGSESVWKTPQFTEALTVNAFGIRGKPDMTQLKLKGAYRILMTGDSFTYGYGLSDNETIPSNVEKQLQQNTGLQNVEVLNTGVCSYSPDQEYRSLVSNIPRFQPNLVVWNLIPWNISQMIDHKDKSIYRASLYDVDAHDNLIAFDARLNYLYIRDYLLSKTPVFIRNSHTFDMLLHLFERYSDFLTMIPDKNSADLKDWSLRKLTKEIGNIQALCETHHCSVILVWLPIKADLSRPPDQEDAVFQKDLQARLDQKQIRVLSVAEEFKSTGSRSDSNRPDRGVLGASTDNPDELFFVGDEHPNPQGARMIAGYISDYIVKNVADFKPITRVP